MKVLSFAVHKLWQRLKFLSTDDDNDNNDDTADNDDAGADKKQEIWLSPMNKALTLTET